MSQADDQTSMLILESVERRFDEVQALRGVSLAVLPGELYGLVGPDGAGKTTSIRLLAGLMAPTAGRVLVGGHDPLIERRRVRGVTGYMPQAYSLYGDLSVEENLHFFARMFGLDRQTYLERRKRLLGITRLAPFTSRRADALSGGMYKKLALACALLHRPGALLLDEPTNGVDPVSRRELWDLLGEFVSEGMSVLVSTPYMDEASRCHRVGLIHAGRLLIQGEPAEMLTRFEHEVYSLSGGERAQVESRLRACPQVLAFSPAGELLRAVVRSGERAALAARLEGSGARLGAIRPDFEDVFLARIRLAREQEQADA
ncbi:MAG: ABC transporter ATP-binding protein [Deltaproteobacteria bacterium]|nr:ABC transporter ATP-binding protein [Deltaproteobacteria bacterium]